METLNHYKQITYHDKLDGTTSYSSAWSIVNGIEITKKYSLNGNFVVYNLMEQPIWAFDTLSKDELFVFNEMESIKFFLEAKYNLDEYPHKVISYDEYSSYYLNKSKRPKAHKTTAKWSSEMN